MFCAKAGVWSYILLPDFSKLDCCIFMMYVRAGVVYGTRMISAETNQPLTALEEAEAARAVFTPPPCSCFASARLLSFLSGRTGRLGQVPSFFLVSALSITTGGGVHLILAVALPVLFLF